MSIVSIILAIVMLSVLVTVHEFGHFIVAQKNGVFVKEFSIGFGPRIISRVSKKTGTRFSWKAIPFGGSCLMLGQYEDEDDDTEDEKSYDKKSVWARMSITLAGPVFNFFLAFVLAVIYVGTMDYDPAKVTYVEEGSPADEAGLEVGDVITDYNGASVNFGREIYLENYLHPITSETGEMTITYERDGESYTVTLTPAQTEYYVIGISYYSNSDPAELSEISSSSPVAEAGLREGDVITGINGTEISSGEELAAYFDENPLTAETITVTYERKGVEFETEVTPTVSYSYRLGFSYNLQDEKTDVWGTIKYSFAEMKYQITSVYKSLIYLFSGNGSLDMLSGPVGLVDIVDSTYEATSGYGFMYTLMSMISLTLMLSANLGVMNLIPFPGLDGGKFLLLIIEAIRRKPIEKKYEGVITLIGATLLVILMVVVMVNDVTKFF